MAGICLLIEKVFSKNLQLNSARKQGNGEQREKRDYQRQPA
jgi:hypothetical protein